MKPDSPSDRQRPDHFLLAHTERAALLGSLSSAIAHETNQPLTAILSNAQAALRFLELDEPDVSEAKEALADIVAEAKRAGAVISRLRDLLKPAKTEPQPCDLNLAAKDAVALVHSEALIENITVRESLAEPLPLVRADRVELQQVVINLLMNAFQAVTACNDTRSRTVEVSTHRVAATVVLSVCDSGPGIEPQVMSRIFEPFFTTKPSGMGLGLAISRSIIESHAGHLWAENSDRGGACISFSLPITPE